MSSLQGAPALGSSQQRKPFSYAVEDEDDDFIPTVNSDDNYDVGGDATQKHRRGEKKKKGKERSKSRKTKERDVDSSSSANKAKAVSTASEHQDAENYEDDFDLEEPVESEDYISTITASPMSADIKQAASSKQKASALDARELQLVQEAEQQLRDERESHERKVAQWQADQAAKEDALRRRQENLEKQINDLRQQQSGMESVDEQVAKLVKEQLAAFTAQQKLSNPAAAPVLAHDDGEQHDGGALQTGEAKLTEAQKVELQRRHRRERERALSLRRAHEEEAAHSLFQRLAQDVREVFHELNLSVVAAEKERLVKDERYRKEREIKDRREEIERAEKLQKELKDREARESKFWAEVEQREDKLRAYMEDRMRRDDEEREARLKRDLEDRHTRARNEKELREELDRMDQERRGKADSAARERDNTLLQSQMDEAKLQFRSQLEEMRHQMELDRTHAEELHKVELRMTEQRHEAALAQMQKQYAQQLTAVESHIGNASRLEKLIEGMHAEMEATKRMHEKLTEERLQVLKEKERQLAEQQALVDAGVEDIRASKQELERERVRIASLNAKFELALSNFIKNSEEDRRRLQEAQAHQDTLRQQAEKDRRLMLSEVAQERKMLEQQQEEFLAKKMESMGELQAERMAIARERTEWSVLRERHNRDETEILKSLRAREEEYGLKVESIDADRVTTAELKAEQRRIYEAAVAEREALRRERELFEQEKNELMRRFEDIHKRAEDAARSQDRLRKELAEERAAKLSAGAASVGLQLPQAHADRLTELVSSGTATRLQMDLARQRAILQKISS